MQSPVIATSEEGTRQRFRYLSQAIGKNRLTATSWRAEKALDALENAVALQLSKHANSSVKLNTGEVAIINNGSFEKGFIGGAFHAREGHITNDDRLIKRGLAYRNENHSSLNALSA